MLAFALVLSLIGYDLVMAADPHWYSTLFGAYSFAKAIYMGLGALIILAAVLQLRPGNGFEIPASHFHDVGKLFFAFCLVWADFFYAQLVVIWYGNISEETTYIIERVMTAPWNILAWVVFIVCFIVPFLVLLNKKVKTLPRFMMVFCGVIIAGMWLEHLLLLGPALNHHATSIPLGITDVLITMGFFGLMAFAVSGYLKQFPELVRVGRKEVA
jgi:Ni/Fe-hydrogenase subunit HybB-like protein